MKAGKVHLKLDQYEKAKKLVERYEAKVTKAKAMIAQWERIEKENQKTINGSQLIAIILDNSGRRQLVLEGEKGVESATAKP